MQFPADFTAREQALLGPRFDALYTYATPQPARGVTVNGLRCTPDWFAAHADFAAAPSPFCPTAFTTAPDFKPGRHPWHHAGVFYAQEPSASAPAALLDVHPGMKVADLCAAPGGKTSQLAAALQGQGLLLANEFVAARAEILRQNLERMGVINAVITNEDTANLAKALPGVFDRVLVDAPCSGEGMFRKDPDARGEWSEGNVKQCAARQDEILREAWRALKPGGTLVYSTCTFNRDEDEGALERMAAWAGDEIAESEETAVEDAWGIVCGRVGAFRTFRFYPPRTCGEGFFAAVARKSFDAGGRVRAPKARRTVFAAVDRKTAGELARWVRNPGGMRFAAVADTCYAWYAAQADAVRTLSEALPVIYSGVALGQVFKGVLKPDPALAFFDGLNRGALPAAELDDEETLRFLRRQDIAAGGLAEGMNLVCSRGRALGFAKRIGARVNNLYPNSLRIIKQ